MAMVVVVVVTAACGQVMQKGEEEAENRNPKHFATENFRLK